MASETDLEQALRQAAIACANSAERAAENQDTSRGEGFANAAKALAEAADTAYKLEATAGRL